MTDVKVLKVFIGSSAEGKDVADRLAALLDTRDNVESKVWALGVFDPGIHVLDGLIQQASTTDFAILVLSPDDRVESRDKQHEAPRDNVVFELGLFVGALGSARTYMVVPDGTPLKLPSDLDGITQVRYNAKRSDGELSTALNPAAIKIHDQIKKLGGRQQAALPDMPKPENSLIAERIEAHLEVLENNLVSQGWKVRWNPAHTTLRVTSPRGRRQTLKMVSASEMLHEFDRFIRGLRGLGARVDSSLRS